MNGLIRWIHGQYERPWLFNLHQTLLDGGKENHLRRFLQDVPYQSVVDIGCGTGNWARLAPGPYLGVDSSPDFIAGCRRRYAGDPNKTFVQADATTLEPPQPYDLALLVSVLHHLSDAQARHLTAWIARAARYFLVLDLYPVPHNPLSRFLYAHDRGDFIRAPDAQKRLLLEEPGLQLVKEDAFFTFPGLYRHTLFLFETSVTRG